MHRTISNFVLRIIFLTGLGFGLHLLMLNYMELPLFADKIVLAYLVNVVFGLIIFSLLFTLRAKIKNQVGFIFIFGSMFKFMLFLAFFYEPYMADNTFSKTEFFALFTPYILTLVIEVFSLSKWLNKME